MLSPSKNENRFIRRLAWLPLCTLLAASPVVMAGDDDHGGHVGHAGDIYVGVENGRITTGLISDDAVSGEMRTFESEFGDAGVPGFTADPGWEAYPGTFNPDARVGWESLAGLRMWNGNGFDEGIEESITVSFGPSSFEIGASASGGFDLAVQPDGGIHRHLSFFLNHPTNTPLPGIYLVELELYATEGPEHSEPFWIVFNNESSEADHEAAVEWVEENLAAEDHDDHDDHDDHGHAGDIGVGVENGHIITGEIHDGEVEEMRTFESEFGESGVPGYTDEPGWEALPGTFGPDVNVGWNALSGVSLWNGAGFDGSIDESITIDFGPYSFVVGSSAVDGFDLPVESDGAIHRHIGFTLNHPSASPQTGIYLVELELYATTGGPEHSEPFWIVFNNGASEEDHEAAVDWVKDNLADDDHDHGDDDDHDDHGDDDDDHDHGDDDDHDDHGHAGDIVVAIEDGHIMTGTLHDGEVEEMRTFESEFGADGYTDEPGWEASSGTFSPDVNVGWNALSGVSLWNGAGFDGSIDESITVGFGTLSFEIGTSAVDGFDLPVESDGAIHRHIGFTLNHPLASPQTGIYLVELEMYATNGGPEHSEPFWIVFNNGDTEANHELAVDWVKDNLAGEDHDHEHCDGDVDGDDHVDVMDLLQLINDWGASGGPSDVNEDGTVNVMDLLVVIDAWGECDH